MAPPAGPQASRSLWAGRSAVLIGLVLLGIGLRHAVTLLSPLLSEVTGALGIGTAGATFLGMLPSLITGSAVCFRLVTSRNTVNIGIAQ